MLSKVSYRLQVLKRLREFAKGVQRFFFVYFGGNLIELVLGLILPLFYSLFIEKIILGKKINFFWIVIIGYVAVQIVSFIVAYIKNYCRYRMTNHVTVSMREKIITNYLTNAFSRNGKISAADAKMVMDDDMIKLTAFADSQSTDYIVNAGKMIILSIILIVLEWRLAVICIAVVPITFMLTEMYGKRSQKIQNISRVNDAKWGDWLYSVISGWREVRAMNLQKQGEEVFRNYSKKDAIYFTKVTNYWVIRNQILPKIKDEFLMQFLVYFLGGILIYYNQISIGTLLVFDIYEKLRTEKGMEVLFDDVRIIHFLVEHKQCMRERIEYLLYSGFLSGDFWLKDAEKVLSLANNLKMIVLMGKAKENMKYRFRAKDILFEIEQFEKEYYSKIVEAL